MTNAEAQNIDPYLAKRRVRARDLVDKLSQYLFKGRNDSRSEQSHKCQENLYISCLVRWEAITKSCNFVFQIRSALSRTQL